MIDKNPLSLRNILSTRAVFSTVMEKISSEVVSENVFITEINKMEYNHHIDFIPLIIIVLSLLSIVNNLYNSSLTTQKEKLERIEMFSKMQRTTSTFLFVFMLIFTKNIDSAT